MNEETNVESSAQGELTPEISNEPASDETQDTAPPETEQDDPDKQERKEPDNQKQSKLDRRIGELTYRARQAERDKAALEQRIAELEKRSAPKPAERPKLENFETNEDFMEALTDWKLEQRLSDTEKKRTEAESRSKQDAEAEKFRQGFETRENQFRAENPDYDDVLGNLVVPQTQAGAEIARFIAMHKSGPDLAYALAKDNDLAGQVFAMHPHYAKQKLDAIATKATAKPQPTQTLPEPPNGLKTSAARGKSLEAMSGDEILNLIKKRK